MTVIPGRALSDEASARVADGDTLVAVSVTRDPVLAVYEVPVLAC